MKAYLIDEGILLSEKDEEFDNYAVAYDKRYGYYNAYIFNHCLYF